MECPNSPIKRAMGVNPVPAANMTRLSFLANCSMSKEPSGLLTSILLSVKYVLVDSAIEASRKTRTVMP